MPRYAIRDATLEALIVEAIETATGTKANYTETKEGKASAHLVAAIMLADGGPADGCHYMGHLLVEVMHLLGFIVVEDPDRRDALVN